MHRPRFGIVEDAEAERERQRAGVEQLRERPDDRQPGHQAGDSTGQLPAAGIDLRDQLL
jgi:hypothetical protein